MSVLFISVFLLCYSLVLIIVCCIVCSDIEKIQSGIGDKVALFLQYFTTFLAGFVIGYATNWKLALVVSVMLPILTVMAATIAKVSIVEVCGVDIDAAICI